METTLYLNKQINGMVIPEIKRNTHDKGYMLERTRWSIEQIVLRNLTCHLGKKKKKKADCISFSSLKVNAR